jgi:hypothetical protein
MASSSQNDLHRIKCLKDLVVEKQRNRARKVVFPGVHIVMAQKQPKIVSGGQRESLELQAVRGTGGEAARTM